ncbi:multiple epidermal growth factor-like domains protein 9 [Gadus macrocephalus]|uniref:multiple epidermal growth factor-like domains protein 9 n=1 Tax=Gadus macrocephalus TaxID=80720 RepID=UPI0028CB5129|nr:multiple epidermal growth factor-like domains protein 9 [Gadus macrocephalus]
MMFISGVLLFILYGSIGFTDAAPRSASYDSASPLSRRLRSASVTEVLPGTSLHQLPEDWGVLRALKRLIRAPGPPLSAQDIGGSTTPARRPGTEPFSQHVSSSESDWRRRPGAARRSTDAQTSVFSPEKMLQMVSMIPQRTANDAWSTDHIDTSVPSKDQGQEVACNCSTGGEGILDPEECDVRTGRCSCVSGHSGPQCDDCEDGHFTNSTGGCLPCQCDSYGAVDPLCDSSGTCVCKRGVDGPKCDDCHPEFFHFSSTGCQPCRCNNHTNYCHPQSGVCLNCMNNTQGDNCEECQPNFYRPSSTAELGQSCSPCPCSKTSTTGRCHADSAGQAVCDACLPGYTGPRCLTCTPRFFRSEGACLPCECHGNADPSGPPQMCDPDTGRCLGCSPVTTGDKCQLCATGFSGNAQAQNCTRAPDVRAASDPGTTPPPLTTLPPIMTSPATTLADPSTTASSHSNNNTTITTSPGTPAASTQTVASTLGAWPSDNTTAPSDVSWTQFNVIILAVIILVVLVLLGFVGGVYAYREYQNRKLNAPFWTIELKEDNISFSSYHDSLPNADVSGLLEDEASEVAPNGQLALTTQSNCYKA